MREILGRLTALCVLAWLGEQLTAGSRLQDGVRLIAGILAAGMILDAVLKLRKKAIVDIPTLLIFIAVAGLSLFTEVSTIPLVLCAGALGYAIKKMVRRAE